MTVWILAKAPRRHPGICKQMQPNIKRSPHSTPPCQPRYDEALTATAQGPATKITIEITNLDELVKEHRGPVSALFGKLVTDIEGEGERAIINALKEQGADDIIVSNICSVSGISLRRFVNS